ncbi:hypothetical protein FS837_006510, partial [Tulasnella sp. UAMH 9824]
WYYPPHAHGRLDQGRNSGSNGPLLKATYSQWLQRLPEGVHLLSSLSREAEQFERIQRRI